MKKLLFTLFTIGICHYATAQKAFVLEGPTGTRVYYNFDSAKTYLSTGDKFYIPGGMYNLNGTWDIGVSNVSVIGAGHDPDSSDATKSTILNGEIKVINSADNLVFEGFYLTNNFLVVFSPISTADRTENLEINRCGIGSFYAPNGPSNSSTINKLNIKESIIRGTITGGNCEIGVLENNFIRDLVQYFNAVNVVLKGNQFFKNGNNFQYLNNCRLDNNIFYTTSQTNIFHSTCSNNYGDNNSHWTSSIITNPLTSGSNIFYNSIGLVVFEEISQYQSLNTTDYNFKEEKYRLATGQPAVGPFAGGYKSGGVPSNPHFQISNISDTTNAQGLLPVQIKVEAQSR